MKVVALAKDCQEHEILNLTVVQTQKKSYKLYPERNICYDGFL